MSIVNALVAYIGKIKHAEITQTLARLENVWKEYNVYTSVNAPLPDSRPETHAEKGSGAKSLPAKKEPEDADAEDTEG